MGVPHGWWSQEDLVDWAMLLDFTEGRAQDFFSVDVLLEMGSYTAIIPSRKGLHRTFLIA